MIDKKIIFVSYYPGSGGQFMVSLVDLLSTGQTNSCLGEEGQVFTARHEITNVETSTWYLADQYTCGALPIEKRTNFNKNARYGEFDELIAEINYTDAQNLLFDEYLKQCKFYVEQDQYVIPTHMINLKIMLEKFPNSKIIFLYPYTDSEFEFCNANWVKKNKSNDRLTHWFKEGLIDVSKYPGRILSPNIFDLFNPEKMNDVLTSIIDFTKSENTYKDKAILHYTNYLTLNKQ